MRAVAAFLAFALVPAFAIADETIATAPAKQSLPAAAPVSPLTAEDDSDVSDGQHMAMGPCGPEAVGDDGKLATNAHGYVEAGVGTSGYRHLAGGVCKPLANGGAVSVSVSETQGRGRYGW